MEQRKTVTAEQMQKLYGFIRQHFVEHYDLQTELADHLANAIEAQWQHDPRLDFDEVLETEFKKFGVFGFMDVVEKRKDALNKRYYGIIWSSFKQFFRLPKLMLTVTLAGTVFMILKHIPYKYEFAAVLFTMLVAVSLCRGVALWAGYRKKTRQQGKKWLMEEIIFKAGALSFIALPQVWLRVYSLTDAVLATVHAQAIYSILFVALAALQYIMLFMLPREAVKHLGALYPEYRLQV